MTSPRNSARARQVPKQDRSRAAVAAIQEATLLVLLEDGFGGLTTNAIADRAGVGIGSIYRYFTNKESIVASLTRNAGGELLSNPRARELFGDLGLESRIRFGFIGAAADQAELSGVADGLSAQFEREIRVDTGRADRRGLRFWQFAINPHKQFGPADDGAHEDLSAEMLWAIEVGLLSTLLSHDATRAEDTLILDRVVAMGMTCF